MHFVSLIIILPHDLIHCNFACRQYHLLHCSSVSSCVCLHMSSWRRTSCSVFPGPLEMLPTSSHISPFHSQCTCPSPLHGPVLSCLCCSQSTDSTCDAPITVCCIVTAAWTAACLLHFSHPQTSNIPPPFVPPSCGGSVLFIFVSQMQCMNHTDEQSVMIE